MIGSRSGWLREGPHMAHRKRRHIELIPRGVLEACCVPQPRRDLVDPDARRTEWVQSPSASGTFGSAIGKRKWSHPRA